jgi:hypothetical protein
VRAIEEVEQKIRIILALKEECSMVENNVNFKVICCTDASDCCKPVQDDRSQRREIEIDFLYLDLSVCTRCQGTDNSLDEAITEASKVLEATDVDVVLNKINVTSEKQAEILQFESSPTIRVNGRDIQLEIRESLCESCGDLCGDEVDCRVWVYHGKEYPAPPKAMIIEAILREVYGRPNEKQEVDKKVYRLPDNLRKFFASMQGKQGVEQSG